MDMQKIFVVIIGVVGLCGLQTLWAQDFDGNKYFVQGFDIQNMTFEQFNWTFAADETDAGDNQTDPGGDNQTDPGGDNETAGGSDNSTSGSVTIEQPGKTFTNSAGSYIATGSVFRGQWQATQENYSNYYEETIYTYYTFLFIGAVFANDVRMIGNIYSTTTVQSDTKGTETYTGIVPFLGVLVSRSTRR